MKYTSLLFFLAYYSAYLIASITVPAKERAIDSLEDLLKHQENGQKQLLLRPGTSTDQLFKVRL